VAGHIHASHATWEASSAHQEAAVERCEQPRVFVGPNGRLGVGRQNGTTGRRIPGPDVQRVVHEGCVEPQHGDRVAVGLL
jgi:hypothetical protein